MNDHQSLNPDAEHKTALWIGLALVLGTLALYWPATHHKFLDFDDDQYVTDNAHVMNGFSLAGVEWAFTTTYAANWHPLTWISHMVDASLYGKFAGGHLLTNLVLHSANALLLFLLFRRMTDDLWPSALVAALFAWHPLHIESVAWVAERKDVLSTFFLLLTLLAYACYAGNRSTGPYLLALVFFALGLMSKPMLVTLPFLLLLIDFWPLNRFQAAENPMPNFGRLVMEKLPFFALSAAACVVTVIVQKAGGAIKPFSHVPMQLRVFNALAAYLRYIGATVWPTKLSVYYPLPAEPPVVPGIVSLCVLLIVSALIWCRRARWPWLATGWFWFIGTLVPVIGLVQVGDQAWADRYSYIPLIGLFIAFAWGLDKWVGSHPAMRNFACGAASILVLACVLLTHHELGYWQDSITLFTRALEVTKDNGTAYNNLGVGLSLAGRKEEAIDAFKQAVRIKPQYPDAQYNLGIELAATGRLEEAAQHFGQVLMLNPRNEKARNNLGVVLAQEGNLADAAEQFREAIALKPDYANAWLNLGMAMQRSGNTGAAITNYTRAISLDGNSAQALDKLAVLYATCSEPQWRNLTAAVALSERANELTHHEHAGYMDSLAAIYADSGDFSKAVLTAEQALRDAQSAGQEELAGEIETKLSAYRNGKTAGVQGSSGFGVQR